MAKPGAVTGRFLTLDAMRGLAALAVVFYHVGKVNPHGFLAVDLFFILSGFVLCHAYGGRLDLRSMLRTRLIRLYPLFVMGIAVGLAIRGGTPLALLGLPDWSHARLYPMNTALWSVAYEIVASLGFALFYRFGWRAWLGFWLGSGLVWLSYLAAGGGGSIGMTWAGLGIGLARMTFAFTTGIALFHVHARWGHRGESGWAWAFCIAPLALTATATVPLLPTLTLVLPALVLGGASFELRARKFAVLSGDISYPLYAIHQPIVVYFGWAAVPFVIVAAWLLDRVYDRPLRRWLSAMRTAKAPLPA